MAPDKHPSGQQAKPFTPTMSSTFRATKTPLTPKLAGYTPTRTTRKPVYTEPTQQQRNTISRPATSTPTSSLLSANVTPRSGLRLSRRDGNYSPVEISPTSQHSLRPIINAVPQPAPPLDPVSKHDSPTVSIPRLARAKSVAANETQLLTPISRPGSSCGSSAGSSMFFHADDTRSQQSTCDLDTRPGPLQKQTTPTTFLYADGTTSDNSHREGPGVATPSDKAPRVPSLRQPELIVPSRSKQPYASTTLTRDSQILRHERTPTSSHPTPSPSLDSWRDQQSPNQHELPAISFDGTRRPSHTKSSSMDASEYGRRQKQDLLTNFSGIPYLTSSDHQHWPNATSRDPSPRVVSGGSSGSMEITFPFITGSHIPVKDDTPPTSQIDRMNELASNARRERKVLDLEISNSSLLAINRTLEREMRKQSAELRRYRRLTRSGRLSMTESIRSVSGRTLSIVSETDYEPSDISLMENSDEDLSSESSDDESTRSPDGTPNSNDTPKHDAKHRTRDEKRFILDLTKHQQLLIDSQKMNQSIKRCLGWTESLIQEGKKALDYHVRISDIDIGGRVLAPDEIEGETEGGRGLLSPTSGMVELYSPPSPSDISLPDSD
ncbi:hypothetical protein EMCG_02595 [[Emmonsia] crescens]|uniref:Uncharacterized protein n=1 Tax=[Emmonsia] crescens TaxID=73230 RepID=A0A0G2HYY3_9EURO|nr:hypothetical protein EMCG_02595 [Emmonsia crescens UAMH 3008]